MYLFTLIKCPVSKSFLNPLLQIISQNLLLAKSYIIFPTFNSKLSRQAAIVAEKVRSWVKVVKMRHTFSLLRED